MCLIVFFPSIHLLFHHARSYYVLQKRGKMCLHLHGFIITGDGGGNEQRGTARRRRWKGGFPCSRVVEEVRRAERVAEKSQEAVWREGGARREEVWRKEERKGENTTQAVCVSSSVCCVEGENGKNVVEKKRNGGESVWEKE